MSDAFITALHQRQLTHREDRMTSQLNQARMGWIVTMRTGAQEADFQVEAICAFVD